MFKRLLVLFLPLAFTAPLAAAEKPVEVMVLGSYHFGNPGMDVNNIQVDSVLTPDKQKQLEAVAKALLTFKPTRVMVERESEAPDFAMDAYTRFTPESLKTAANETDQIGYRVAHLAGLKIVHGIDEQPKDGEPDYFPFTKLQEAAAKFGQTSTVEAANGKITPFLKAFEADQKTQSVAQLLMQMNAASGLQSSMAFYYDVLTVGDKDSQPGADLNAMWYLRNAKIFGKLMQVAKPGDRVLVVYGAGHNYWLRHFAREVPGYVSADPVPYLKKAGAGR